MANFFTEWTPYDAQWLIHLARLQHADKEWLADAFAKCTMAKSGGKAYVYFVDHANPNRPGSAWQFDQSLMLECPERGEIVVDVLKGARVGGIEFLSELLTD
ncbi:MAG TPA: hypothetical protein VIF60_17480 [Burkholderiaceae bacterium]